MERRCQQVIDGCIALGADNPILSIHDMAQAGSPTVSPSSSKPPADAPPPGNIHNEDSSMSPMEILRNESQERYVMAVMPDRIDAFTSFRTRERRFVAIVGEATDDGRLVLEDLHFKNKAIDMEERPSGQDPEDA